MKNTIALILLLIVIIIALTVNDADARNGFTYKTIHNVTFDIRVSDVLNNPIGQAVLRVTTEQSDITNAVTGKDGVAAFTISISDTANLVSLIIEHPGYDTKTVYFDGIQDRSIISRTVYLGLNQGKKPKPDRDGDGVPDDADEFPDDPFLIGTAHGRYIIVYEVAAPEAVDADFNDCAARLDIREYIDNNNMISRIVVTSRVLAAGARNPGQLWISVLNKEYRLILDVQKDLGGSWNTRKGEAYFEGPVHTLEIPLEAPIARDIIEPMPYDPYLVCGGARQAHLPFVKTKVGGTGPRGGELARAILLPADWAWPYEGTMIDEAYPEFRAWYETKGREHRDWYLHPEIDRVYKVSPTSVMAAYFIKASSGVNRGILLGIITLSVATVAGISTWRKRRYGEQRGVTREYVQN